MTTVSTDYRVSDVAEAFGVKPRTIRDWIRRGKLHAYKVPDDKPRSEYRVPASEVERIKNRSARAEQLPQDLDSLMDRALSRAA